LRLRTGLHEPTFDQQDVEAFLHAVTGQSCRAVSAGMTKSQRGNMPRSRAASPLSIGVASRRVHRWFTLSSSLHPSEGR
jgi:transcriptional regulator of met regulon